MKSSWYNIIEAGKIIIGSSRIIIQSIISIVICAVANVFWRFHKDDVIDTCEMEGPNIDYELHPSRILEAQRLGLKVMEDKCETEDGKIFFLKDVFEYGSYITDRKNMPKIMKDMSFEEYKEIRKVGCLGVKGSIGVTGCIDTDLIER